MDQRTRRRIAKALTTGAQRKSKEGIEHIVTTLAKDEQKALSKKHG